MAHTHRSVVRHQLGSSTYLVKYPRYPLGTLEHSIGPETENYLRYVTTVEKKCEYTPSLITFEDNGMADCRSVEIEYR